MLRLVLALAVCMCHVAWSRPVGQWNRQESQSVRRNLQQGGIAPPSPPTPPANTSSGRRGDGFWSVQGTDYVDTYGNVVRFSGVVWSGFETPEAVPHGLWNRSYQDHLDQMKQIGFNMIRLAFAGETLLPSTYPMPFSVNHNPELSGMSSLQIMDKIIEGCGQRGIKIILDYHRMHLTTNAEIGTWWDDNTPESVWINNWAMLAQRYKGNPTIIGADLFNEPHSNPVFPEGAPFWAPPLADPYLEKFNFRSATLRVIEAIHAQEPNWIIFMEGMWNGPYWWGGNVAKLLEAPIMEPRNKLAYSTHEYGPYVFDAVWFNDPSFPNNLEPLYRRMWGSVIENGIGPVWVGEMGSFYLEGDDSKNERERVTFNTLVNYIQKLNASWTIAFWNPNSIDTGGILMEDWHTPDIRKLAIIERIMHFDFI